MSSPRAIVCVGMAGSGKTTFMQRINAHLHAKREPPYIINLDPAVRTVPFESNVDIRESVDYKEVMRQYNLGPNGGILTSLNLFATKIDQIIGLLEKRTTPDPTLPDRQPVKNILIDTPGQIEVFVWSASGSILLDSLASSFPTVLAYIIDTPRTSSTSTFMSNMLYACSILYKTKLPMILVFNKTDVRDAAFAKEWMTDFEAFQAALRNEERSGSFGGAEGGESSLGGGSGYMGSLLNSMSLVLEEFYHNLSVVGVSSLTGHGVDDFFTAVDEKVEEFNRDYRPELERRRQERDKERSEKKEKDLGKLLKDLKVAGEDSSTQPLGEGSSQQRRPRKKEPETVSEAEDEDEDEDEDEEQEEDILAEYVEPDDDVMKEDDDDEDEDEDEDGAKDYQGSTSRGQQASRNNQTGSTAGDESFARYLRASGMNT
ncbi:MAG: hypothetical protein M1823_005740 [Watsoniomyces obsoletus]|nr:MAG: hypothetical protein M1823_005740 [Watsoniomyces obsoletus]